MYNHERCGSHLYKYVEMKAMTAVNYYWVYPVMSLGGGTHWLSALQLPLPRKVGLCDSFYLFLCLFVSRIT